MSDGFDRLAKMLGGGGSRRDALKALGGLLAGSFLAGFTGSARAQGNDDPHANLTIAKTCQKYCAGCPRSPGGAHGKCIEGCKSFLRKNPDGSTCGTCSATTPFSGANLASDVKNCGTCGKVCTGTTPGCCSGTCVDLDSDAKNCGACGTVCSGTTPNCKSGKCAA